MSELLSAVSRRALPTRSAGIPLFGAGQRIDVYETCVEGAREGRAGPGRLLPGVLASFFGFARIRNPGALGGVCRLLTPVPAVPRLPPELLAMSPVPPLSAGASLGPRAEVLGRPVPRWAGRPSPCPGPRYHLLRCDPISGHTPHPACPHRRPAGRPGPVFRWPSPSAGRCSRCADLAQVLACGRSQVGSARMWSIWQCPAMVRRNEAWATPMPAAASRSTPSAPRGSWSPPSSPCCAASWTGGGWS